MNILELEFSNPSLYRLLHKHGISTVEDLTAHTADDLLRIDGFGRKRLNDVQSALTKAGRRALPHLPPSQALAPKRKRSEAEIYADARRDMVRALIGTGVPANTIADALGITTGRVYSIRRMGEAKEIQRAREAACRER